MTSAGEAWLPKSILLLRGYDRHKFLSDLIAGVTVGLVALPLAVAFAIASGVSPQAGLYCAIVTGFLISALGGSKTQIGGPTGAFVVVVAGIIAKHGIEGLFICTMMAGVLLVLLGVTGMGTMVKYFPRPVVVGFTNGIAILIASTQIRDFFGLKMEHVPGDFFHHTVSVVCTVNNDALKVKGILNEIKGLNHDGTPASGCTCRVRHEFSGRQRRAEAGKRQLRRQLRGRHAV
jgi:MFS superfamily sulfate permease-like transporter